MTDRVAKIILRGEIGDLLGKLKATQSAVRATVGSMTDGSKESLAFGQNLSTVGDAAGKLGLVSAVGVGLAVRAFANFDEAISHVAATGSDAASSIDALREAALEAGSRTQYSATEAANAIEELAKAGVSAKDVLGGALNGSLDLAAAGGLEVADAASIAATTLNQFGLEGEQASHVADLLASAANSAQGSVTDVGQALKYVGPVAAQMGVSLEETTGTIAELASQGILADNAGTALRGMLTALTSPSKIAATTMAELGINVYDAQGNLVGFKGIAGELKETMSGLSNAERDQALGRIFGNEQITAARILYQGGAEDVAKWTAAVDQDGAAAATAAQRMDNLKGDLEQLKGAFETALIGSATSADGPLRELTQSLTNVVNAYNSLPGPLKSAALGIGAVTAAAGLGLFAVSKTIVAYTEMRAALLALGVSGTRTAAILKTLGVAALAVAAVDIGAGIGDSLDSRNSKEIDELARSLERLSATGKATGDLGDLFGDDLHGKTVRFGKDLGGIGESIASLAGYADDSSLTEAFKFLGSGGQSAGIVAQAEAIGDLDKALASLAEDDPAAASAAFEKVRDVALDTGANAKEVAAAFPLMSAAAAASEGPLGTVAAGLDETSTFAQAAADQVKAFTDSINALFDPLLSQEDASNAWKDSIASLTDSLRENGPTLDDNTDKGRANQDAIRDRVKALKDSVSADAEAGVEQEKLSRKLLRGAESIVASGRAAGISEKKVRGYLKQLGLTPAQVNTIINADTAAAAARLRGIKALLATIGNTTATAKVGIERLFSSGGPVYKADGGPIAGPGTATSDSIPAYLSDGEYVIRAAAVAKYGTHMFDSLNAGRFAQGGPVGYASGGSVSLSNNPDTKELRKSLDDQKKTAEKLKAALEKNTAKLDDLRSEMKSYSESVASNFRNDPFDKEDLSNGVTGLQALKDSLLTDKVNADGFAVSLATLKKKGINGAFYKELAASGDVDTASELADLRKSQIDEYDALFLQSRQAATRVGRAAGTDVYGKQIVDQTSEIRGLRRDLKQLTVRLDGKSARDVGAAVGSSIKSAAGSAQHAQTNRPRG